MPEALIAEHGSDSSARDAICAEVRELERAAAEEAKNKGQGFLGAERAVRTERGSKWELFGARNPTFAAGGDLEAALGAVDRLRGFRASYREVLAQWRNGDRDVTWPPGTWWMRVHHIASCATGPQPRAPD